MEQAAFNFLETRMTKCVFVSTLIACCVATIAYNTIPVTDYTDETPVNLDGKVVFVAGTNTLANELIRKEWRTSVGPVKYEAAFIPYQEYRGKIQQGLYPFVYYNNRYMTEVDSARQLVSWLESGEELAVDGSCIVPRFVVVMLFFLMAFIMSMPILSLVFGIDEDFIP